MKTRAQRDKEFMDKHDRYMRDAATEIEVSQDEEGRWQVRCYRQRGNLHELIGGTSSISSKEKAEAIAAHYQVPTWEEKV